MSEPVKVKIVCSACDGKGLTVGYPNQTPTDDPGEYTCWACDGKGTYDKGILAPGELERLLASGDAAERLDWPARFLFAIAKEAIQNTGNDVSDYLNESDLRRWKEAEALLSVPRPPESGK